MLTFLPAILLLITALAVFFLRFLPRGVGYAWLTSVFMTLLIWGGILAFHWIHTPVVNIPAWRPFDPGAADAIRFSWDSISWLYGFTLVSVCLAVLMTSGARLQSSSNPLSWAANLTVTAAGLVAVLADTPLAMVLTWMLLDAIDLLIVLRLSPSWDYSARGVMVFVVRGVSISLMVGALVVQRFIGVPLEFDNMSPLASLFVLLSLGLRLGLLPLNLPYVRDFPFQRDLISNLRLTAHVVGLAALARISQPGIPGNWLPALYTITVFVCLYGAIKWVSSRDEISGRPFWLLTLSGLAFISVLQGKPEQSTAWGLVMAVSGAVLFLFSARTSGLLGLPLLGMVAVTGLPFTPASSGWGGLILSPFGAGDVLMILTVTLLLVGYGNHARKEGDNFYEQDGWVRGIYPVGLIILLASGWIAAALGIPGGLSVGLWWASAATVLLAGIIGVAGWKLRILEIVPISPRARGLLKSGWNGMAKIFSLGWFYGFLWSVYRSVRRLVAFLSLLFEGEGGLLWSFLLLALMLTILFAEAGIK